MGRLILEHEGTLERFTGDGMMIFFNDPVRVADPAPRAARMVIEMQREMVELAAGWGKRGYDLQMGAGIAQGFATIGGIGFPGRIDYGAIGNVTNLAARLCGEAKGGEVLLAQRVHAALDDAGLRTEAAGELTLKGFARPVPAYQLAGGVTLWDSGRSDGLFRGSRFFPGRVWAELRIHSTIAPMARSSS